MLETAVDNLRFGASVVFGRPFHLNSLERLVAAMSATRAEMGSISAESSELLDGPRLDDEARKLMQISRLRRLATRAARETEYYAELFRAAHVDPARLTWEDIARIPITSKEALRDDPDAFVRRGARPSLRATTTGTTGKPTTVHFSEYELRVMRALAAIYHVPRSWIEPDDLVHVAVNTRAVLGIMALTSACAAVGATIHIAGLLPPERTLEMLAEPHRLPGMKTQVTVMRTYPSYLGALVECARRLHYRPADFGLRRVLVGGEILTQGLRQRSEEVFGPLQFDENFSMTELAPFGGNLCSAGHLHFEPSVGLVEVSRLDGSGPAAPGEAGQLLATPLPPFRDTTLLLRYATGDVVNAIEGPLNCDMRHTPATGRLDGKVRFSVRHDQGWTMPRDVVEALESDEMVPLPARYGSRPVPGGVAVEVLARSDHHSVRRALWNRLTDRGVPVRDIRVVTDPARLCNPVPLRADLHETSFADQSPASRGRHDSQAFVGSDSLRSA